RRRHTRFSRDWSSDVCSSDLGDVVAQVGLGRGSNLKELKKGDAILVVAADLHEEAPVWWLRVKQAAERGATLVVLNARATRLDKIGRASCRERDNGPDRRRGV